MVRGKWADIPFGQMKYQMRKGGSAATTQQWQPYHGELAVRIGADGAMRKIDAESSDFGCTQWRRSSSTDVAIPDLTEAALKCGPVAGDGLTGLYDNDVLDHGVGSGMYFVTQVDDAVFWLDKVRQLGSMPMWWSVVSSGLSGGRCCWRCSGRTCRGARGRLPTSPGC